MKVVFTNKRILSYCSFNSNQRPAIYVILTFQSVAWLHGFMHTMESGSAMWCTLQSVKSVRCTSWSLAQQHDAHRKVWHLWDAHHGVWLSIVMHAAKFDICEIHTMGSSSATRCTPQSLTSVRRTRWGLAQQCDAHRKVWHLWDAHHGVF